MASTACTDWDADGRGGPWLQSASPTAGSDAGANAGLTAWDTWKAPDAAGSFDTAGSLDAADASDTAGSLDTAEPASADVAPADAPPGDAPPSDGGAEDAGPPFSLDGKGDFVGWPELPPDAAPADATAGPDTEADVEGDGQADAGSDAAEDAQGDAEGDAAGDVQAEVEDVVEADAQVDADSDTQSDTEGDTASDAQADVTADSEADALGDVQADTAPDALPDAPSDVPLDAMADAGPDTAADGAGDAATLPDGAMAPDWQGYPDLPYAADADIYGGAIGSCLSLYLYQQEFCGANNPTAACINSVAKDGSLFAQFQYEPLRDCQTAVCTDLCALASDKACMEGCIVDYCAAPFLACTSNGAQGTQSCAEAWKCSKQYPDKLLTISAKCYAAASPLAQQQFSAVIGCVGQPQSQPCIGEVATCFADPAAPTQSCSATLTCMNSCNNDEICNFTCLGQANPQAVTLLDAIWGCQLSQCAPKCAGSADPACSDECLKNECQSQLVQCLVN